ncbi:fasciclin domain-containing protein [Perlabentimonas gracilis]|uniref:fasciclin domain-containing protein n=1 Tax=Perlabentimonas gracilis TaxID=2715279 RepID=UPI001407C247|nr:fasciclin domain-containing protein [Perlabentimonas gracilis]NHB68129.1 fasciclin domain-containing protein [Perlabentimonas gracilis]
MKTMRTRFLSILALALVATFTLTSCEKDDVNEIPAPTNDVVELAQATTELSTLVTAVVTANLVTTLKGSGPFTVFAPTNDAFAKLEDGVLEVLLANPTVLADLLKYHVVSGKVLSTDLTTTSVQTLLSGKSISVSVANGVTLNGTASVVEADIEATNGVVHVIDEVLIPEGFELPKDNIVSIAAQTPSLSILVEALSLFPNLVDALSSDGSFTVFAPTNDAFIALLGVIGQESLSDIPESVIERLLKYHVISGAALMSTDLSDGQMASTLLSDDDKIKVQISGQSVKINGANVTAANIEASNGVVHVVDAVLVPALELSIVNTIVQPAYFSKSFSVLTQAVVTAGLLETLVNPDASFTLFAPSNDAFEAAGITSLTELTANDLTPILTYHVLGSKVYANGLPSTGSAVTTLNGDFYLSINDNGVFINGVSQVTVASQAGSNLDFGNGVVHVINRTLLPTNKTIVDIAVEASQASSGAEFGQLVAALTAVENDGTTDNLITILSGDGPFTVFAPTDAAFQALYTLAEVSDFNALVDAVGIGTIEAVLKYHVLGARVFSTDLPNLESNTVATLGGNITIDLSALKIIDTDAALELGTADASIVATDIMGTNGVIHVIDQVILP